MSEVRSKAEAHPISDRGGAPAEGQRGTITRHSAFVWSQPFSHLTLACVRFLTDEILS